MCGVLSFLHSMWTRFWRCLRWHRIKSLIEEQWLVCIQWGCISVSVHRCHSCNANAVHVRPLTPFLSLCLAHSMPVMIVPSFRALLFEYKNVFSPSKKEIWQWTVQSIIAYCCGRCTYAQASGMFPPSNIVSRWTSSSGIVFVFVVFFVMQHTLPGAVNMDM